MTPSNFKSDISRICSKDDLRPAFTVVHFKNGYAYATDAHCLIKQSLAWMDFTPQEIAILNGKSLSPELFKIVRKGSFIDILEDGIQVVNKKGNSLFVEYSKMECKFPEYDSVIPTDETVTINQIGFMPKIMANLLSAMHIEVGVRLSFYGEEKAILVTANGIEKTDQVAIVMPTIINND